MIKTDCIRVSSSLITFAVSFLLAAPGRAANTVRVACELEAEVPTVKAILSNQKASQVTSILSFLPQYFESEQATQLCKATAAKLQIFYSENKMNYLASDSLAGQPVICAVERRGLNCDSYNSDILFSLDRSVSPNELLYNMLGENFKGSQAPSSRTVSRIYTDLRPLWWPF